MKMSLLGNLSSCLSLASPACKLKTCSNNGATGGALPTRLPVTNASTRQPGNIYSQFAAYLAFAATAFACIITAVASHNLPMMLEGS